MKLKFASLTFIVLLGISFLSMVGSGGDGSWGIPLSFFIFALLVIAYGLFWIGGNIYFWTSYQQPDKKLVGWLLNLPALVLGITILVFWVDQLPPRAAFTLQLINENQQPLKNVPVRFGFRDNAILEHTDEKGEVEWRGAYRGGVYYQIELPDHYPSEGHIYLKGRPNNAWPLRRIEPWDPVINIVLNTIQNPIPLYVKNIAYLDAQHLPDGKEYGFDLMAGDWVAPIGDGKVTHITLQVIPASEERQPDQLLLTFPGENNGIQRVETDPYKTSLLKLPRHAPESGYESTIKLEIGDNYFPHTYNKRVRQMRDNYFFRVENSLYGKIIGPIRPFQDRRDKKFTLYMHYYLNPNPGDTNLEFDPTQNLFHGEDPYHGMTTGHHYR